MNETKPWYASRTVWASVAALVAMSANLVGYEVDPTFKETFISVALQGVALANAGLALYYRVTATSKLVTKKETP